ncbi:ABC transporter substrate-binding protein [Xanthovirga aplysinae]|uniref:ABC transporter substrate-binding protein n=1 Tax=Xanthovirga aplysinae TaxID=2529853 RepID=UPI0012BB5F50|nr:ABC transporter substrate-binding protein [Xanthovirga aplysinae]MTI31550.1 amino acid ABC transporter substrate-binding protein [Xanthovirga aplysinae]
MRNFCLFILFFTLILSGVSGQKRTSIASISKGYHVCDKGERCSYYKVVNNQQYLKGKNLFEREEYRLAMEEFKPLTHSRDVNPYKPYAMYFYALSAYKVGEENVSRDMFLQLKGKFREWDKLDEVNYWLGLIYFEKEMDLQAEIVLAEIKNPNLLVEAQKMKFYYLRGESISDLQELLEETKDADIASLIGMKILAQPLEIQDHKLLNQLLQDYQLDPEKFEGLAAVDSEKKAEYNLAVLLPFMTDELLPVRRNLSNQFVIDLYQGMEFAQEDLETEGIKVNLFAYDTQKDQQFTEGVLNQKEMDEMDLIIGPLYPGPSVAANDFSFTHQTDMVNPLSFNSAVIEKNPYSFLFNASDATQAKEAAKFAEKEFEKKTAMIIYGSSKRDSIWAYSYKTEIESKGISVIDMLKVDGAESREIINVLSEMIPKEYGDEDFLNGKQKDEEEEVLKIAPDSLGHIFLATNQKPLMASTISAIEIRGDNVPVLMSEGWLSSRSTDYDQLGRLNVYFMAPTYINYDNPEILEFKKRFQERSHTLPSINAYIGYDLLWFFGKMMNQYGNHFQYEFPDLETFHSKFLEGVQYKDQRDNQVVPIITLKEGEVRLVNKESY